MRFEKWQALGNDYLIVEAAGRSQPLDADLVRRLCDRDAGPGADGGRGPGVGQRVAPGGRSGRSPLAQQRLGGGWSAGARPSSMLRRLDAGMARALPSCARRA